MQQLGVLAVACEIMLGFCASYQRQQPVFSVTLCLIMRVFAFPRL